MLQPGLFCPPWSPLGQCYITSQPLLFRTNKPPYDLIGVFLSTLPRPPKTSFADYSIVFKSVPAGGQSKLKLLATQSKLLPRCMTWSVTQRCWDCFSDSIAWRCSYVSTKTIFRFLYRTLDVFPLVRFTTLLKPPEGGLYAQHLPFSNWLLDGLTSDHTLGVLNRTYADQNFNENRWILIDFVVFPFVLSYFRYFDTNSNDSCIEFQ